MWSRDTEPMLSELFTVCQPSSSREENRRVPVPNGRVCLPNQLFAKLVLYTDDLCAVCVQPLLSEIHFWIVVFIKEPLYKLEASSLKARHHDRRLCTWSPAVFEPESSGLSPDFGLWNKQWDSYRLPSTLASHLSLAQSCWFSCTSHLPCPRWQDDRKCVLCRLCSWHAPWLFRRWMVSLCWPLWTWCMCYPDKCGWRNVYNQTDVLHLYDECLYSRCWCDHL